MEVVDNIMITEVVDGMISNNPGNKIATEEKIFKYLEEIYLKLAVQAAPIFLMMELKHGQELIPNALK